MADASTVNTKVDAAITAIGSSDWTTAEKRLLEAEAALAAMPDSRMADNSLEWDRQAIARMIAHVQRKQRASGGLAISHVEYEKASDD